MYMHGNSNGMAYGQPPMEYGTTKTPMGRPLVPKGRKRMNIVPIVLALFVPWLLFTVVYAVLSFSLHYDNPGLCWLIVFLALLATAICGILAMVSFGRKFTQPAHEPTWYMFIALAMLLAWILGVMMGRANYSANMQPFYDFENLNTYESDYPNRMRGQQLMDAGRIDFVQGTVLDLGKSMGFKNVQTYCVAPITLGNSTLKTYDFWAVGKNCCSGSAADFHCAGFNNPRAHGGLRLMRDGDRAFYRLAMQQAESVYKIKAVHPLFFNWVNDPLATSNSWKTEGIKTFIVWVFGYFVLQAFLVAVATMGFSRLGKL